MRKLSSAEYRNSEESRKLSLELSNLRSLDICHNLATPQDFSEFQQRFESVNQVGSGTFGSVYLVKDSSSNDVAAAKYLRQTKESVRNEAAILFQLIQSAFIVKIIGLYESPLHSVLVTEYLSGGDLVTRYTNGILMLILLSVQSNNCLELQVMTTVSQKKNVRSSSNK